MNLYEFNDGKKIGRNGYLSEFETKVLGRTGDRYYFRAVTESEFKQLNNTNSFGLKESYQGICTNLDYVKSTYFGPNKESQYIIEFEIPANINLIEIFRNAGTGQKNEGGGMSLGLGTKATPVSAGAKTLGGEVFMGLLKEKIITWRLIAYIGKKAPKLEEGKYKIIIPKNSELL